MALGSPHESYDAESASNLLRSVGEQAVAVATKNLMSRGILSKLVRDPQKQKPGRQLKISEMYVLFNKVFSLNLTRCISNQNALGGSISRDTFQDAATLEDIAAQEENTWREWPILATDGDNAALIQLASDNSVRPRYNVCSLGILMISLLVVRSSLESTHPNLRLLDLGSTGTVRKQVGPPYDGANIVFPEIYCR
jgi:Family of unknown function (DUF6581)